MNGGWFDEEAIQSERFEADLQQAELERRGNRLAFLERKGICTHEALMHLTCRKCGRVFKSDEEWMETLNQMMEV